MPIHITDFRNEVMNLRKLKNRFNAIKLVNETIRSHTQAFRALTMPHHPYVLMIHDALKSVVSCKPTQQRASERCEENQKGRHMWVEGRK